METVLICDDDQDIRRALRIYLIDAGYAVLEAENGRQALEILDREEVHLILLDIMMPEMDGVSTLSTLRGANNNIPVILLTAMSEDEDKIQGLELGADDYITKPFKVQEVIARVRAVLRRYVRGAEGMKTNILSVGGIEMDDETKIVTVEGEIITITPKEYDILKLFLENPGKVFSSREIYQLVWQDTPIGAEGTVAVHIRHLREKVEINPSEPRYLKVIWGKGYKLEGSREKTDA